MMPWRKWALTVGALFAICGIVVWTIGGGPVLLILGLVAIVSASLEPIYGRAVGRTPGGNWRPTDEKFVDPESGKLVTVWFDPATGDRRYISDSNDA
jgi:hypothetical protein